MSRMGIIRERDPEFQCGFMKWKGNVGLLRVQAMFLPA